MSRIITTKYGRISGVDMDGYVLYKGIPYAKPPVGDLRWCPPQEVEAWDGVLKADDWKNKCIQPPNNFPPYGEEFYSNPEFDRVMSEDCLYLHIWTPKEPGEYPVAIWFHGGAFITGYSTELEFDGAEYTKRGVIFVSVEYRCNIFGFLCHPWLSEENPYKTSGNYGIMDQFAALGWIHENIKLFGGDPKNITIFGQSAGAMSVQTIVSSSLSKGLVSKAIMQSGGSYKEGLHFDLKMSQAEEYGNVLTDILKVNSLKELREMDAMEIFAAFPEFVEKVGRSFDGLFLIPVIDGRILKYGYYEAIDKGEILDIPYLLGSTKNDILTAPDENKGNSVLYRGSKSFSIKMEELGRKPAYVYWFSHNLPGDNRGAWHSSELWYMFGTLDRCWRPFDEEDYALSGKMLDYWTEFMKKGNPNSGNQNEWRPCSKDEDFVLVFK